MKKIMFLFTLVLCATFAFIGGVNAVDEARRVTINTVQLPNTTDANAYWKFSFSFATTYNKDSIIAFKLDKSAGVDHFTTEFITTNFEVVSGDASTGWVVLKLKADLPAGEYDFAKVKIYDKEGTLEDCVVYPMAYINESNKTCADSDGTNYYNDYGEPITESEYGYYCQPHICEKYQYKSATDTEFTTVYYDVNGYKVATEAEMIASCKCRYDEKTNKYYDDTNTEISEEGYNFICKPHVCTPYEYNGKTYYYNAKGEQVSTEEEMIAACKCRHDETTDKYYDLDNKETTKEEYEKICLCRTEDGKDGKIYYCKLGELCTKEEFDNKCPENVKTGSALPIALVAGGLAIAGGAIFITARNNKLRKI